MFTKFLSQSRQNRRGSHRCVRDVTHRRRRVLAAQRLDERALLASVSGVAFEDLNSNGVHEAGEGRLVGVTVYLDQNSNGALDPGEASRVTASDGSYRFDNLPAGNYTVREAPPTGYEQTGPVVHDLYFATTRPSPGTARQLVRVDAETGQLSVVGPLGISRNLNGLVRTNNGSMFAIAAEGTGNDAFYSVNPGTGAATFIGSTGMEVAFGLAYDPASDTIYGIGQVAPGLRGLVTFDQTTGRATAVTAASSAEPSSTNGIAFDPVQNRVLAYNFNDGQIYGYDPATGQRSTLAKVASGLSASLAFADGQLVTKRDFTGMINEFITINPDTGQIGSLFFASVGVVFESLEFVDLPDFTHTVTLSASQNLGDLDFGNFRVNSPPSADAGGPYVIDEGDGLTLDASGSSDPDGDALTYTWDLDGDGQFDDAAGDEVALSWGDLVAHGIADDGAYAVSVRVSDGVFTAEHSANIVVHNASPGIVSSRINAANVGDVRAGQRVSFTAQFTDAGPLDTHSARIDWGDGSRSAAKIADGTISGSHIYKTGGVFHVSVTLKDDDSGAASNAATAFVTGARIEKGVLQIVGSKRADSVSLVPRGSSRLQARAAFLPNRSVTFARAKIKSIEVYLGAGNDKFTAHRTVKQPLLVVGGAGADQITAGGGRSLLIGGAGADQLNGGANQDLLFAGTTAFDNHPAALRSVLAEWSSSRSLKDRVANLYNGSGRGSRANGDYFLTTGKGGTVVEDRQRDILNSGAGTDWLFYDRSRDRTRGSIRDDLFANDLDKLLGRA